MKHSRALSRIALVLLALPAACAWSPSSTPRATAPAGATAAGSVPQPGPLAAPQAQPGLQTPPGLPTQPGLPPQPAWPGQPQPAIQGQPQSTSAAEGPIGPESQPGAPMQPQPPVPQPGSGPMDASLPPPVAQPDPSPSYGMPAQTQPLPVALLLPPRSGDFGRAAAALRAGFEAARAADADPVAVEVVESGDGKAALAARYAELAARGVGVVVGPLTRSGVNALVDLGRPPLATLTLNQPDAGRLLPDNALAFGLPIEDEVRQLARLAYADAEATASRAGRAVPRALIISASSPLARRAAAAAYDAWREQGGTVELPAEFEARAATDLRDQLAALQADAVFVTGPADLVRVVRAALAADSVDAPSTPVVYATSLMTAGGAPDRRLPDVDGVRMVEMPWFAAAQRDDIKALPRPRGAMANVELQRLYALGIDAYRVAAELARGRTGIALDGATGRLSRDAGGARLERAGLACEWRNGMLVPIDGR